MGCDRNMACRTCCQDIYLGYGPYSSWPMVDTIDEIDALPDNKRNRLGAILMRKALVMHDGHDFEFYSDDYTSVDHDGNLRLMGAWGSEGDVLIEGFRDFEKADIEDGI